MLFLFVLVAAICISSPNASADSNSFVLAKDGKSAVTIVIPKDLPGEDGELLTNPDSYKGTADTVGLRIAERRVKVGQIFRMAADDLALYIEKTTGADVSIVSDDTKVDGYAINLGLTSKAKSQKLNLETLKWDGYIISSNKTNIFICGNTEEGTANGVYGFLRDYVGVRWYMPGELWEVVPAKSTLKVKISDKISNPDYEYRNWTRVFDQKWEMRNRTQGEYYGAPYFPYNHNMMNIFAVSKYGKEHPEYYSEVNGKRLLPSKDGEQLGQQCFTNPDVIKITVEAVKDFFKKYPEATQFSLAMNDDYNFCTCENCMKLDAPVIRYQGYDIHSDSYFYFVSEVAKQIAITNPGKTIGCYAYENAVLPPKHIKQLPDNVVVKLTQDTSQFHDPKYMETDKNLILQWSKISKRLIKYDYYGLGWFTPRYYPHIAADDIKYCYKHNVIGQYNEIYPFWANIGPQIYVGAQLLWDTNQNADRLLDEYFNGLYGNVAPQMKQFYSILETNWLKKREGKWFEGILNLKEQVSVHDSKSIDKAMNLLESAKENSSGIVRERVENIQNHFEFPYLLVNGYYKAISLKDNSLKNQTDVNALSDKMLDILNTAKLAKISYENYIMNDPYYNQAGYGTDSYYFWIRFEMWEKLLTTEVKSQFARIREFAQGNMSQQENDSLIANTRSKLSGVPLRSKLEL